MNYKFIGNSNTELVGNIENIMCKTNNSYINKLAERYMSIRHKKKKNV